MGFTKNNITYRLFIKEKPVDYQTINNYTDYFIDDIKDLNKFINFVKIYSNYNVNDNSYNIESNFINNDLYTNTTIPVDI